MIETFLFQTIMIIPVLFCEFIIPLTPDLTFKIKLKVHLERRRHIVTKNQCVRDGLRDMNAKFVLNTTSKTIMD